MPVPLTGDEVLSSPKRYLRRESPSAHRRTTSSCHEQEMRTGFTTTMTIRIGSRYHWVLHYFLLWVACSSRMAVPSLLT